jgi:hypothetical protein
MTPKFIDYLILNQVKQEIFIQISQNQNYFFQLVSIHESILDDLAQNNSLSFQHLDICKLRIFLRKTIYQQRKKTILSFYAINSSFQQPIPGYSSLFNKKVFQMIPIILKKLRD